jgi:2-polyprenyl-3-methyl-5-hydroxy-6-metoxy-1,4-benzoquinol methylase
MKILDDNIINQTWPANELEYVDECPYCQSSKRNLAYENVQDWTFYCAPGKWSYWNCGECDALYLNPRPNGTAIGRAYTKYYTHDNARLKLTQRIKNYLRTEWISSKAGIKSKASRRIPIIFNWILWPIKFWVSAPFELNSLIDLPKKTLIDVGCGDGGKLQIAQALGWQVIGIEIDPQAVKTAQSKGLSIIQGDYRQLEQYHEHFDCIICSHVLEHVHDPLILINMLMNALRPSGVLLLSLPNAKSYIRFQYHENWRGIEAPRHISIPSLSYLRSYFYSKGYQVEHIQSSMKWMKKASSRIVKDRSLSGNIFSSILTSKDIKISSKDIEYSDFIQFICTKL